MGPRRPPFMHTPRPFNPEKAHQPQPGVARHVKHWSWILQRSGQRSAEPLSMWRHWPLEQSNWTDVGGRHWKRTVNGMSWTFFYRFFTFLLPFLSFCLLTFFLNLFPLFCYLFFYFFYIISPLTCCIWTLHRHSWAHPSPPRGGTRRVLVAPHEARVRGTWLYLVWQLDNTFHIHFRASASFYFALVNLTKECKISLVKCQMA